MAEEKRPQHDSPEHKHNDKLQGEYWDTLVSIDRVAMLTESTCEFSQALFTLCTHILASTTPENRAAMLAKMGTDADTLIAERKMAQEVASEVLTVLDIMVLGKRKPGAEH